MTEPYRSASAGLGHGSTALIVACVLGEPGFPPIDNIQFADTGDEREGTYRHADRFREWLEERGHKLVTVRKNDRAGSISQCVADRKAGTRAYAPPLPLHLAGAETGRALQGCTRDWKMRPLDKRLKRLTMYKPKVEVLIGYTVEEITRIPGPATLKERPEWPDHWTQRYPLCEQGWNRAKCVAYIREKLSWPVVNSCCWHCAHRPTTGPGSFDELRQEEPESYAKAVQFDALIRESPGLNARGYLSALRLPLPEAIDAAKRQGVFPFAAGDGSCDGGTCWT